MSNVNNIIENHFLLQTDVFIILIKKNLATREFAKKI